MTGPQARSGVGDGGRIGIGIPEGLVGKSNAAIMGVWGLRGT